MAGRDEEILKNGSGSLSSGATAATSARSCGYAGSQHNMPDFPLIGLVWHRNGQQPAEQWHTDHTNRERPPAATILYGVEIPSAGGGTSVANMREAYARLRDDERRRLESLTTFNGLDGHADTRPEDQDRYGKPVEHPMVRTHPVHGSRAV